MHSHLVHSINRLVHSINRQVHSINLQVHFIFDGKKDQWQPSSEYEGSGSIVNGGAKKPIIEDYKA